MGFNDRFLRVGILIGLAFMFFVGVPIQAADDVARLKAEFQNPPAEARPWAYWCWMNGNFRLSQITNELEAIKHMGIGGFNIFDIGAQDPNHVVPAGPAFMGPESLDAIGYAIREAERLGLGMALIVSSSWDAGGSWIPPELGTMGLFTSTITVDGPIEGNMELPFPDIKSVRKKKNYKDFIGDDGLPLFYKDVSVLAIPAGDEEEIIKRDDIIDLTAKFNDEQLQLDLPEGKWTIIRYVCTNTGETLKLPSPNSNGLSLDHFNPKATALHFNTITERLQQELGDISSTALDYLYLCSYEVRGKVWTPDFIDAFKKRRGYDMTPFLPALYDRTIGDEKTTRRFLFDYKKTLSDLIIENHYMQASEISHNYGLKLCSEAGGPGQPLHNCPVESLRALGTLDIPRGEFWNKHQVLNKEGIDLVQLVKEIACASHIYGKTIVQGEAFTSFQQWQEGPFELKPLADRAMCEGLNHFVFHTSVHTPPEAGVPGWVYHAGTHINPTRVWWPKAKPFVDYLSRCSYLLQQGLFVGDVCFYYGDQAPNFVKPKHIHPSLGYGYDYDVTNSEVILERMSVKDGRIVLPDGMSYAMLVLPNQEAMNPEVLKKLETLVSEGAVVVGRKPTRAHSLHNAEENDEKIQTLANQLWGPCDGEHQLEHTYGKGKIVWGKTLRNTLNEMGIGPDFQVRDENQQDSIDYIHRRAGSCDMYFVVNRSDTWQKVECGFRVKGKLPELWYPDSGKRVAQYHYRVDESHTWVPLELPPSGSVFVCFEKKAGGSHVQSIAKLNSQQTDDSKPVYTPITQRDGLHYLFHVSSAGFYQVVDHQGKTHLIDVDSVPSSITLEGPWEVIFPHGWGVPTSVTFPELISWPEHELEAISYFSGIAAYKKTFNLPDSLVGNDDKLFLDLGKVKEVADVYLNGHQVGIVWKEPYRVDISQAAQAGKNYLVIEVANVWNNRLVGDGKLPEEERRTHTNITRGPDTWGKPWKDVPLLDAGLLGPVKVLWQRTLTIDLSEG